MLPMKHTSVRPLPIGQTVPEVAGLANQKKIRKTQKTEWVLKNPQLRKIQKNQQARLMTPRKATGSGLDAAEFRDLRETGVEDALVVATLEEAMRHQAKHPWCYAKRLLDQAAAQHVTTFAEWEKTHIKNKGNRVDRETPSGNNILGLTDSLGRIKRRPFKKQDVPQGKGGDSNGE